MRTEEIGSKEMYETKRNIIRIGRKIYNCMI